MMKSLDSDTKSAGMFAWAAMRDARMRNEAGKSHFTSREIIRAERMKLGLEMVYHCKAVYINFRKDFIAVKVDEPQVSDRKNLALLEKDYDNEGVIKLKTKQGFVYRIPKA